MAGLRFSEPDLPLSQPNRETGALTSEALACFADQNFDELWKLLSPVADSPPLAMPTAPCDGSLSGGSPFQFTNLN